MTFSLQQIVSFLTLISVRPSRLSGDDVARFAAARAMLEAASHNVVPNVPIRNSTDGRKRA